MASLRSQAFAVDISVMRCVDIARCRAACSLRVRRRLAAAQAGRAARGHRAVSCATAGLPGHSQTAQLLFKHIFNPLPRHLVQCLNTMDESTQAELAA